MVACGLGVPAIATSMFFIVFVTFAPPTAKRFLFCGGLILIGFGALLVEHHLESSLARWSGATLMVAGVGGVAAFCAW